MSAARPAYAPPRLALVEPVPDASVLFASVPVACALLNASNRFSAVNPAAEQFFSLSQSQLRHLALADLAAAAQAAIADQLAEKSAIAMRLYAESHSEGLLFAVAGGVAANGEVRRK